MFPIGAQSDDRCVSRWSQSKLRLITALHSTQPEVFLYACSRARVIYVCCTPLSLHVSRKPLCDTLQNVCTCTMANEWIPYGVFLWRAVTTTWCCLRPASSSPTMT